MDRLQPYRIADTPGVWQYWSAAEPHGIWVVPADIDAQAFLANRIGDNGFLRVAKNMLIPVQQSHNPASPTLF